MKWLDRLEYRFRRYGVRNLMNYLVGGMAAVYVLNLLTPNLQVISWLDLRWSLVMRGQVWRLLTFVFVPPSTSPIFVIFSLYFYWLIGSSLEHQWGRSRFTLFYLIGIIGNILAAVITGGAQNAFLNLSLFLAFAATYPDYEVLVFFILPVKMKVLALLNLLYFAYLLIAGGWATRAGVLASLLNVILFFGGDLLSTARRELGYLKTRRNFRNNMRGR